MQKKTPAKPNTSFSPRSRIPGKELPSPFLRGKSDFPSPLRGESEGNFLSPHVGRAEVGLEGPNGSRVLYEDNHIIVVYKESGEIVQGDKTGDKPLSEIVKDYIKEKYAKPGQVFLGVVHRLDRPVAGLVMFAKTSKALSRLNEMFQKGEVHKTYWAICEKPQRSPSPSPSFRRIESYLVRNEKLNKSFSYNRDVPNSKKAVLEYRKIAEGERYDLLEVRLLTGRHHQIRCQLSSIGSIIKGDLKYGARRSNPDGSISLLAHHIEFVHPVSKQLISLDSPLTEEMSKFAQSVYLQY